MHTILHRTKKKTSSSVPTMPTATITDDMVSSQRQKLQQRERVLLSSFIVMLMMLTVMMLTVPTTVDGFSSSSSSLSSTRKRPRTRRDQNANAAVPVLCSTSTSASNTQQTKKDKQTQQKKTTNLSPASQELAATIVHRIRTTSAAVGHEYAATFGLDEDVETTEKGTAQCSTSAGVFALLDAIKTTFAPNGNPSGYGFGLDGHPFVVRKHDFEMALLQNQNEEQPSEVRVFAGAYTMADVATAVDDDFLDASRGSTNNRKGWTISPVSLPTGDSFLEAKMSYQDILTALEKGTVIFNAYGAHVPHCAGPCLAVSDATSTPNALNLYLTQYGKRTSAPPHTDQQDVVVIQTSGSKQWKVYAPLPERNTKDVFARGKGTDDLPLHLLESTMLNEATGTKLLLLDLELTPGDILFIPAGFPHTTSTNLVNDDDTDDKIDTADKDQTSIHWTFNIDTHVWDLDYVHARRLALRRANVVDTALGQAREEDNVYIGTVTTLPSPLQHDLFRAFPLGFLQEEATKNDSDNENEGTASTTSVEYVTQELQRIAELVDPITYAAVEEGVWSDTVHKLHTVGQQIYEIHREMYVAALDEGKLRTHERAMTAHLQTDEETTTSKKKKALSPEQIQRLSLFRVQRYFDQITTLQAELLAWSYEGTSTATITTEKAVDGETTAAGTTTAQKVPPLPHNWAFTLPLKVGDDVEADLGGALFPAKITKAFSNNTYDVEFFDGDRETGMERASIKLLKPPALAPSADDDGVDTSQMTAKQLKRYRKAQQKEQNKNKKKK